MKSQRCFSLFDNLSFTVDISYESLNFLKNYSYDSFRMNSLNLNENNIETLQTNTIKGLYTKLSLENNFLESVSFQNDSFGYLPNLIEISFSKNIITKLEM